MDTAEMSEYKDYEDHHLYWFLYDNYDRQWNDFKGAIGWRGSDPWWIRRFVDLFDFVPEDDLVVHEENMTKDDCCKITSEQIVLIVSIIIIVFLLAIMFTMSQ